MIAAKKNKNLLYLLFLGFFAVSQVQAQFTVRAAFNSDNQDGDIVIGGPGGEQGAAYLTSGIDDPVNSGWLRLTSSEKYQKGYAFIDRTFPSTLGVLVDFEYKMWRDLETTGGGGDGFSVFLFDGAISKEKFRLGGYGGSLGYAPNVNADVFNGLKGGYIGIGFDAHGNYANDTEGRIGGEKGKRPNAISLRGPTKIDSAETNRFLAGVSLINGIIEPIDKVGDKTQNEIHFSQVRTSRPTDEEFYRRVQIEIIPFDGQYKIVVRWKRELTGEFQKLFDVTTTEAPPETLKLGFAASSGSAVNYHEIRSLVATTPGNLRVTELAEKDILRANVDKEEDFTYILEVNNDTDAALNNIDVKQTFTDGEGNPVPEGMVKITGIKLIVSTGEEVSSYKFPTATVENPITSGFFIGKLGLPAKTEAKIEVVGELKKVPEGNLLVSTVNVDSGDITDEDLENNISFIKTPVYAEGVDLVVQNQPSSYCLDPNGNNNFSLTVSNLGNTAASYNFNDQEKTTINITNTFPEGVVLLKESVNTDEWTITGTDIENNVYTFTKTAAPARENILQPGASLPPLLYSVTSEKVFTSTAEVSLDVVLENSQNIETSDNTENNVAASSLLLQPGLPDTQPQLYFCQGAPEVQLSATPDPGNRLIWYNNIGGVKLANAPTIDTSLPGTMTYYVSQTNGNCESELAEIRVSVLGIPKAGEIAAEKENICEGEIPKLNSVSSHSITNSSLSAAVIFYQWEQSLDGSTWEVIPGATAASYAPAAAIGQDTWYRRTTFASLGGSNGVTCRSETAGPVLVTTDFCDVFVNPVLPSWTVE